MTTPQGRQHVLLEVRAGAKGGKPRAARTGEGAGPRLTAMSVVTEPSDTRTSSRPVSRQNRRHAVAADSKEGAEASYTGNWCASRGRGDGGGRNHPWRRSHRASLAY